MRRFTREGTKGNEEWFEQKETKETRGVGNELFEEGSGPRCGK